jgi:hypothetical protein
MSFLHCREKLLAKLYGKNKYFVVNILAKICAKIRIFSFSLRLLQINKTFQQHKTRDRFWAKYLDDEKFPESFCENMCKTGANTRSSLTEICCFG